MRIKELPVSELKGAIFDLDGTLLESMHIWETLGARYLASHGKQAEDGLRVKMKTMTLHQSADYFKNAYGISLSADEIYAGMGKVLEEQYYNVLQLKPYAAEFLKALKENGVKIALVTATDRYLSETALIRLGVRKYFDVFMTTHEYGKGKRYPDIFYSACEALGTSKENTVVFEDAQYAVQTLHDNGFHSVAVEDASCDAPENEMRALSEAYITCYSQLLDRETPKKVLTIAGSDCSGGAGIQADIKTIAAHKMYAMSAITALTAQNTTGVYGISESTPEFLDKQLECIFDDIFPNAVKIGMVSSIDLIKTISSSLKRYKAVNIVVDPVMVSTSGSRLMSDNAIDTLVTYLLPLASVITPNISEAEVLCGFEIRSEDDMVKAAKVIYKKISTPVLIKGGHLTETANDLLYDGSEHWFEGTRIENNNTHGTGCTLSSAIACGLAAGKTLEESIKSAKEYVSGALRYGMNIGKGSGPLFHQYN